MHIPSYLQDHIFNGDPETEFWQRAFPAWNSVFLRSSLDWGLTGILRLFEISYILVVQRLL